MALFYIPEIENDLIMLPEKESHHITRVLRMKEGDSIEITNGEGVLCYCSIETLHKNTLKARVKKRINNFEKRHYRLHIAIAPTKSIDRFEWFLEKATEIGIDEITPLITFNSERKMIKPDRLDKVIISAMKQSVKAYKPVFNEMKKFDEFIAEKKTENNLCIAHCHQTKKTSLQKIIPANSPLIILIGPEGDFSEDEVTKAVHIGYKAVSLGNSRLRTETAGVMACAIAALKNGY